MTLVTSDTESNAQADLDSRHTGENLQCRRKFRPVEGNTQADPQPLVLVRIHPEKAQIDPDKQIYSVDGLRGAQYLEPDAEVLFPLMSIHLSDQDRLNACNSWNVNRSLDNLEHIGLFGGEKRKKQSFTDESIFFLTPCHAMPLYSHLHSMFV